MEAEEQDIFYLLQTGETAFVRQAYQPLNYRNEDFRPYSLVVYVPVQSLTLWFCFLSFVSLQVSSQKWSLTDLMCLNDRKLSLQSLLQSYLMNIEIAFNFTLMLFYGSILSFLHLFYGNVSLYILEFTGNLKFLMCMPISVFILQQLRGVPLKQRIFCLILDPHHQLWDPRKLNSLSLCSIIIV